MCKFLYSSLGFSGQCYTHAEPNLIKIEFGVFGEIAYLGCVKPSAS